VPTVGGPTDQVQADLPVSLRLKNIGGTDGAGLCVFTSITHAARFQNELGLWDFQKQMSHERGGGWPSKVDAMIKKYSPSTQYLQYEGGDPSIIKAALQSGRMVCVTWNGYRDPHYHGQHIAHMVNCIAFSDQEVILLDNNFIGDAELLHMTPADFLTGWKDSGSGWAVVLLASAPAPIPHNLAVRSPP
jgi:hypothetical protein